jgi:hypothetical protein
MRLAESGGGSGEAMALLPREWLRQWRAFASLATRRGSSGADAFGGGIAPLPPPSLAEAIRELCCSCHPSAPHGPRLAAPPPGLEQRRGKWVVVPAPPSSAAGAASAADAAIAAAAAAAGAAEAGAGGGGLAASPLPLPLCSPWEVVPADAAAALASLYGSPDLPTVRFRPVVGSSPPSTAAAAAARGAAAAAPAAAAAAAAAELVPSPPVCAEAVTASAAAALDAALSYREGTLQLEVCRAEDVAPGGPRSNSSSAAAAGAPRLAAVGQRARRGRAAVEASAADSLWTVKLRAFEHLGVHPKNADVYALRRRRRRGEKRSERSSASPERAAASASAAASEAGAKEAAGGEKGGDRGSSLLPPALVATAAFAAVSKSGGAADFAWELLENDNATLRELRVPDGALLRVVDAGRVDAADLSFVCGNGGNSAAAGNGRRKGRAAPPERGFAGTVLFGGGGGGKAAAAPAAGGGEAKKQKKEEEAEEAGGNKEEEGERMEVEGKP